MECSEPGTIRDEELLAYLAGERVRPAVVQHLGHCQHCSAQLAEYRRIERTLVNKLYRWDCPPNLTLGEYQLGLLDKEHAMAVRLHLSQCVLCAAEVATLTEFLTDDPMLVERVPVRPSSLNHHRPAAREVTNVLDRLVDRSRERVRRIKATLLPPQPRFAYQRNVAQPSAWPRRYTAEDVSISIQVEQATGRKEDLQLIGFVTRKGAALEGLQGVPVLLSLQSDTVYSQNIDELGNFVFSSIAPATYTLELQFPESTIVIEHLPVTLQD
ncbi:MAG TPA: hypothetical protein VKV20_15280 [Ktedonobacteraceae bacterium]|jgi:anti-sigma factor RsiW|nr:hypothetical protein [Ktedonobacteraceae bacterium]